VAQRLDKPWLPLDAEAARRLPGQLGVYQIADASGQIVKIGAADARQPFGLRSALEAELAALGAGHRFRVEVNQMYRTRWAELLMVHRADHGALPPANEADAPRLGRLSPGARPS
jgi:hypothetical protein